MKLDADMQSFHAPGHVGPYRVVARIGGGPTSVVYSGVHLDTGLRVAVKMIATDLQDEPETRERFFREAAVMLELQHQNIVRVIEAGEDHGRPFIAMELLEGLPLGAYLRSEPAPLHTKLALMMQLCSGLQAAHDRGVVHRDIKPTNLFVASDGCLKILDFGLARLRASTLTARGQIVGTPEFMSPEQAAGRQVDARSDLFSAAAVSYSMLTGRSPFAAADLPHTLHALLHEDPAPIAEALAPAALSRVLRKALSKVPDDRYPSCAEMRADLERVDEGRQSAVLAGGGASSVGVARS